MLVTIAEGNTGHIDKLLASLKKATIVDLLAEAQSIHPHTCQCLLQLRTTEIPSEAYYWLVVEGPDTTDPRFQQGIKDVIAHTCKHA
jgi:hypothetical protein